MNGSTARIVLLTLTATLTAIASQPPVQEGGAPNPKKIRVFYPNAGYLRTLQQLRIRRLATARDLAPGATPTVKVIAGTRKLPVICVNFANTATPFPTADYERLLFDPTPGAKTMTQYYRDVSGGVLNVTGRVLGWYKLPNDDTYYEAGANGDGPPFGELLKLGLDRADAEIDFGEYDNDGPDGIPNSGDDDGKVDTVVFVHPEYGAECDRGSNIWSHSWHYSEPGYGHTGVYETRAIRRDSSGRPRLGAGGVPEHIVVEDYVIQPGRSCDPNKIIEIGVFCHEFGHALGLPDLYDRTPNGNADSSGAGHWCLMASGSYGGDGKHAETPAFMSAWCREFLGWAQVSNIALTGTLQFEPTEAHNKVYRVDVPGTSGTEYFLLEYRQQSWTPPTPGVVNWDQHLPQDGVAIWHVDNSVGKLLGSPTSVNPKWPFAPHDHGQNDSSSQPNGPGTGFVQPHALVAMVEADGLLHLARGNNRGDAGDVWKQGQSFVDDTTFKAGSRTYSGAPSGIDLNGFAFLLSTNVSSAPAAPTGLSATNATGRPAAAPAIAPAALADASPALTPKSRAAIAGIDRHFAEASKAIAKKQPAVAQRGREPADLRGLALANQTTPAKINEALANSGTQKLSDDEVLTIVNAKAWEIDAVAIPENKQTMKVIGAVNRTKRLGADSPARNAMEVALLNVLRNSAPDTRLEVQSAPGQDYAEIVTGLAVPAKSVNLDDDARQLLAGDFRQVVGQKLTWLPATVNTGDSVQRIFRFNQVTPVNDAKLPIFGATSSFFYTQGNTPKLTSVVNKAVDTSALKVTGTPGRMSASDARDLVSAQAGVPKELVEVTREGVYLPGGDPGAGKVAIEVLIKLGGAQEALRAYVDTSTGKIIEVE